MQDWALSGRDDELERLTALLAGGGTGALVVGDSGIGKSHLVAAVAERISDDGLAAIAITATPGSALLPLGSLAQLMPMGSTSTGLPVLPVLRQVIAERAAGRRAVLAVDDVQLLDDASAVLVNQLVLAGDVGLIATQRARTIAPEPIARLWQDGVIERTELGPLRRDDVALVAGSVIGTPLDEISLELVWRTTEGNALFVREVLVAARESSNLEVHDGEATIRALPVTSPRLVDFVRHRIGDLDPDAAEALLLVAVGEPLGPGELPARVGPELLARLHAADLLRTSEDGRRLVIQLAHPLFGEVLRAGASPFQLQQVHRDLADAVRSHGVRRRYDLLRLAHWSVAGLVPVERQMLVDAALIARFGQDMDLARDLAERAWAERQDFAVGELLADVYYEIGDTAEIERLWPQWSATASNDDELARVDINVAVTQFWKLGDAAAADVALDHAESLTPSPRRDEATAVRSLLRAAEGRADEAIRIGEPLVDRSPDRVLVQTAMALTHAYRNVGRPDDAVAVCDRALDAYAGLGEQIALITMRVLGVGRTIALAESGRLAEAEEEARRSMQLCRTEGEIGGIGLAALVHGWVLFLQGRLASAVQATRLAEGSFRSVGHLGMQQWAETALVLAAATAGDVAGAGAALERLESVPVHPARLFEAARWRARAWTAMAQGDPERARAILVEAIDSLDGESAVNGEMTCLYDLARLGDAAAGHDRMVELAGRCQGSLVPAMVAHVAGMVSGRADQLGAAAEQLAGCGALLWAAEAAYAAADAARRTGDPRMAAQWSRLATDWRGECETAATPGLVADLAPVPLTRREREVAILAAGGLAAREIGERLFVSRRTVESHLARVYGKLGISSRAELAALVHEATSD